MGDSNGVFLCSRTGRPIPTIVQENLLDEFDATPIYPRSGGTLYATSWTKLGDSETSISAGSTTDN